MKDNLESIWKKLCECTSVMVFMLVRRKMNKEKLQRILITLRSAVTELEKLLNSI